MSAESVTREHRADVDELVAICRAHSHDTTIVLLEIARRLDKGAGQYGELGIDSDRRNWEREAHEEVLDLAVYSAIQAIKRRRAAARIEDGLRELRDAESVEHARFDLSDAGKEF